MTGIIYKLYIGDYWYIGQTIRTFNCRFSQHNKACFNTFKKSYHTKKYKIIRSFGVKRKTFKTMVKHKIVYKCDIKDLNKYENFCIDLNNPWCLNMVINKTV